MELPAKLQDWQLFFDPRFAVRFQYPRVTPQGHPVIKKESRRDDAVRIHFVSKDSQELYFEVTQYASLPVQTEYRQHKQELERRLDDFAITELNETNLTSQLAQAYSFR